jgi:chloramphenicol-sensitive protein RarD
MRQGTDDDHKDKSGLIAAIFSYLMWGIFPIYWRLLSDRAATEILSHRLIWSGLFYALLAFAVMRVKWRLLLESPRREWWLSMAATLVLTLNWGIYIYAVNTGRIVEGSLAYFINPLLNVVVGVLLFGETLSKPMKVAIGLAAIGVIAKIVLVQEIPWIALTLATSFCIYGILKKKAKIPASMSSVQEGILGGILGLIILSWLNQDSPLPTVSISTLMLFIGSGLVTGLPLYLFSFAAQRVPYSLMGLIQFIAPSLQLIVGVAIYKEPFPLTQQISFGLIWLGVIFYCVDRGQTMSRQYFESRKIKKKLSSCA